MSWSKLKQTRQYYNNAVSLCTQARRRNIAINLAKREKQTFIQHVVRFFSFIGGRACARQQLEALNELLEFLGENASVYVDDVDDEGFVAGLLGEWVDRLPRSFAVTFEKVTSLTLMGSNNLTDLSPILGMRNLHDLSLRRCNGAFALPTGLGDSTGLKELSLELCLNFDYSSLTRANLAGLEILQIYDDHNEQVPLSIFSLAIVRKLYLSFARVKSLPPLIGNLQQLDELHFRHCTRVESIALGRLVCVKTLDFFGCRVLTELSVQADGLNSLEHINLWGCRELEWFPARLAELQNLRMVELSDCYKLSIPDADILECSRSLVEFNNEGARDRYTDAANRTHDLLRYMVCLNKAGRRLLGQQSIPSALWSHVLGRCSNDIDCLLFFLKKMPHLVPDLREDLSGVPKAPDRKRKASALSTN